MATTLFETNLQEVFADGSQATCLEINQNNVGSLEIRMSK